MTNPYLVTIFHAKPGFHIAASTPAQPNERQRSHFLAGNGIIALTVNIS